MQRDRIIAAWRKDAPRAGGKFSDLVPDTPAYRKWLKGHIEAVKDVYDLSKGVVYQGEL